MRSFANGWKRQGRPNRTPYPQGSPTPLAENGFAREEIVMEPWHKIAEPRREAIEGRSCNPDEFAIAQHKRMDQPIVVLKEGRVVSTPPDQIRVQKPQDPYGLKDSQT
jgi:hypothetical protein